MSLPMLLSRMAGSDLFTRRYSTMKKKLKILIAQLMTILRRRTTLSSQKEAGSAANAKTTTSRVEKPALDARNLKETKTKKVNLSICTPYSPSQESIKRLSKNRLKTTQDMNTAKTTVSTSIRSSILKRELVTGPAKDVSTITSVSAMFAICAI